jgi:3-hydroxyisobutyrate dehydrogenase-like beta-hydroxyacid dehydrogenase
MVRRVCVIGLGAMGGAIAANLADKGHDVTGYDLSPVATQRAGAAGIRIADSIASGIADAEFILVSLPNSAAVLNIWTGSEGLLNNAAAGTFVIEMSSIDPQTMRRLAREGAAAGLRVLDCPVSGGPAEAAAGQLTLLVGGDEPDLESARSLLDDIGASIAYTGLSGTGKIVKIVNNIMAMGNVLVAAEAFTIGTSAGMDPQRLLDVLSISGGRSHHLLKRFPKAIRDDFRPGFKLWLGEKDVNLGLDLARSVNVPAPAASLTREIYRIAMAEGLMEEDIVAVLKVYRAWAAGHAAADSVPFDHDESGPPPAHL